jgi:predicted transport protein
VPIFSLDSGKLKEISDLPFKLEKDLQETVEKNLDVIFGLEFVSSEFQLQGLRIDTLAYDKDSDSFVIIEYKREKSSSVVDQGLAYLSLLLNNKAEFILLYNEHSSDKLRKDDVDWSQSKVIFIANSFTAYQKQALGFKDLPIELWEVKQYSNKTMLFNQVQSAEKTESINKLSTKSEVVRSVSREIKTYTEEYHFEKNGSQQTREFYEEIKQRILSLGDNIEIVIRKKYIAFKSNYNFVYINFQRNNLYADLSIHESEVEDPKHVIRNMEGIGHYGAGQSRVTINDKSQIPYLMGLIEQSYTKSIKDKLTPAQKGHGKHENEIH